ncbi:MAG: hypothetical protein AAGE52_05495 [Myxococcota bacterium]
MRSYKTRLPFFRSRALFRAMLAVALGVPLLTSAQESEGAVHLPLSTYHELAGGGSSEGAPRYALANMRLEVTVDDARATVVARATVRTFGEDWVLVPLPAVGGIVRAKVGSAPAELVERAGVLGFPAHGAGTHELEWTYHTSAVRHESGWALALPTGGAGAELSAVFRGGVESPLVMPAGSVSTTRSGSDTRLTATVPAGAQAQISWRADAGSVTLSRARYQGEVVGESMRFSVEMSAELEGSRRVLVPLFPATVALESISVDRTEAAISVENGRFVVPIRGAGRHRIQAVFLVPIARDSGLPSVNLSIASTPVSRFELQLPGDREVEVSPGAGVLSTRRGEDTVARFSVPMSEQVRIQWSEAVPETNEAIETRAHAEIVHVVRPDDGVLGMRAIVTYAISRGAMRRAEVRLPPGVQVNAVENAEGVISDWRVTGEGNDRTLTVYLDREVEGSLALDVHYERAWPVATRTTDEFSVPLLRALGVHRQRGMVALLAMNELTLEPRDAAHVTRVGDNQLPTHVRDQLQATVAHTYRYLDEAPVLSAVGATREPEPARFDAQVDTLVSLGDVSTTVASQIEVDVKSGSLSELTLEVPEGLNVLEVSAPSLRRYVLEDGGQLRVELTQPMEGRFTIELLCDRVTGQEEELAMPLLGVAGAEVERGRVGVEALAAFQVDMASAENLSPIDVRELPEPLLLRTDNPILHAYRYAQADAPPRFSVRITRHQEISTRHATVEEARYGTLYTRDGVAVTTARFVVRNRNQQFLRVQLPPDSEVWSARVDGREQTPALEAGSDEDEPTVLLNIVSAADAFEVVLTYSTRTSELGTAGRLSAQLPALDIVVTRTLWEVLLPAGVTYAAPSGSLTTVEGGGYGGFQRVQIEDESGNASEGVRYVFSQMYVGSDDEVASFSIPYARGWGAFVARGLSGLGALLLWLGIVAIGMLRFRVGLPAAIATRIPLASYRDHETGSVPLPATRRLWGGIAALMIVGTLLLAVVHGWLALSLTPVYVVSVFVLMGLAGLASKVLLARMPKRELAPAGVPGGSPETPGDTPPRIDSPAPIRAVSAEEE